MRDLLIYGALFLGWLLFNWIASRAKGRQRAERAAEHARNAPGYATPAPPDTEWGRARAPEPEPEPEYVPAYHPEVFPEAPPEALPQVPPAVAAHTHWGRQEELARRASEALAPAEPPRHGAPSRPPRLLRRPRVHTRRDLREAMVLTAVLGPCRADQPWEPPGSHP